MICTARCTARHGIECEACHTEITTYPHPPTNFRPPGDDPHLLPGLPEMPCSQLRKSARQYACPGGRSGQPGRAHLHRLPRRTQCAPARPARAQISTTCGKCHTEILRNTARASTARPYWVRRTPMCRCAPTATACTTSRTRVRRSSA